MINLSSCNRDGIQGILLLFRKSLNINLYNFGLVLPSNNLSDRHEYFRLDSLIVFFNLVKVFSLSREKTL